MIRRLLPLLALCAFAFAHGQEQRTTYACDDGSRLEVSFSAAAEGRPQATLHLAGGDAILPLVPAASGALYRAGELRLHTKGDDAFFEDGKQPARRCSSGATPQAAPQAPVAPAAPGSFVEVTGTVAYLARIALPPDAVLVVRIQDVSRADAPARTLAEQRIELAGQQVPIPFRMMVDRDLLRKNARISVAARIQRGSTLLFINDTNYPAFANGQPRHVEMVLKQVGGGKGR